VRDRLRRGLATVPVAAVALAFASPLVGLALGSLRPRGLPPPAGIEFLPPSPSLAAYAVLPDVLPVATYLRNSLLVVTLGVPLTVLVASLAGYAIRVAPTRVKRTLVVATVLALLIPLSALWATRFALFRGIGVIDTLVPLWSVGLIGTSPFLVLVYAWAFGRLSDDMLDAAAVDGAGHWRVWFTIGLPQVRAATVAVVVLSFAIQWGNFIDPLLYLTSQSNYTVPLGLQLLGQLNPTDFPLLLAGAVLASLPSVVVFGLGQRTFLHDPLAALRGDT
jgi:multiple sugar transport system permease protein